MTARQKERIGAAFYASMEPFHAVAGSPLTGIWKRTELNDTAALLFQFEAGLLQVAVDPDDDTVALTLVKKIPAGCELLTERTTWRELIGKSLSSGRLSVNEQGYVDSACLDIGDEPTLCITAVASSLKVGMQHPLNLENRLVSRGHADRKSGSLPVSSSARIRMQRAQAALDAAHK